MSRRDVHAAAGDQDGSDQQGCRSPRGLGGSSVSGRARAGVPGAHDCQLSPVGGKRTARAGNVCREESGDVASNSGGGRARGRINKAVGARANPWHTLRRIPQKPDRLAGNDEGIERPLLGDARGLLFQHRFRPSSKGDEFRERGRPRGGLREGGLAARSHGRCESCGIASRFGSLDNDSGGRSEQEDSQPEPRMSGIERTSTRPQGLWDRSGFRKPQDIPHQSKITRSADIGQVFSCSEWIRFSDARLRSSAGPT